MATADEILAGTTEELDSTLVIDSDLRTIGIPKHVTIIGVESDDEVLRLKFRTPRFYCGFDLATFDIAINYENAHKEGDVYDVEDAVFDLDYIEFSWLVGRNALKYEGKVNFIVCMKLYGENSTVLKEFNTTLATLPVLKGLETTERVAYQYADILDQWRKELFGAGDTVEQQIKDAAEELKVDIEAKGAEILDSFPDDYITVSEMANNAIRTRANAIVVPIEGKTVTASDCCTDHLRNLRIFGRSEQVKTTGSQLLPLDDFEHVDRGLSIYVEGGIVTVSGTANATSNFNLTLCGKYTGTDEVFVLPAGTYTIKDCMIARYDGVDRTMYENKTVTFDEDFSVTWVATRSYGATESVNEVTYPMINAGDVSLPWEPYSGGTASPSPSWNREIVDVGYDGEINFCINGAQLFNVNSNLVDSNVNNSLVIDGSNITVTYSMYGPFRWNVKLPKYTDITLSCGSKDTELTIQIASVSSINKIDKRLSLTSTKISFNTLDHSDFTLSIFPTQVDGVGTFAVKCLMVNTGTSAQSWEPYKTTQTFTVRTENGLAGIPVSTNGNYTDSNGQQWICDEIDLASGVYIQRINRIRLDGTQSFSNYRVNENTDTYIGVALYNLPKGYSYDTVMCTFLNYGTATTTGYYPNTFMVVPSGGLYMRVEIDGVNSLDMFKTWLMTYPQYVYYARKYPITTPLRDSEIFNFSQLRGNYPNLTVTNDSDAHMEVKYNADTQLYFNNSRGASDEQVQNSVEAWLSANLIAAEGVSF